MNAVVDDMKKRMDSAIETYRKELGGLRTGRASPQLLDPVVVDAYGSRMPISQVGNVNTPEPRLITVQVWDQGLVGAVEKAITEANLGLNPSSEGNTIRLRLPDLTQERRQELTKLGGKYAESARIAVRNVRRDGMESAKKQEKDKKISQDDLARLEKEIQKLTDDHVKKIDEMLASKEKEIMQV
ncbi:MAG: ribosome recycling factor [Alphaproteobacteria bacterium]|nr:MAG: ribosome recycling factor [Alphaproteobacteria bacterium]